MKQWSLKSVSDSHNYQNVSYSNCHDNFINWVSSNFDKPIDIVDIGGGNGRVLIKLKPHVNNYYSLDLNPENIKIGSIYFSSDKNAHFIEFDIDDQELNIKCDVIYIDSVLTMVDDPFGVLFKCKDNAKYIFINRTIFGDSTFKDKYKWGGMEEKSVLWKFDYSTMNNFCDNNNLQLIILTDNSFLIKRKKNY